MIDLAMLTRLQVQTGINSHNPLTLLPLAQEIYKIAREEALAETKDKPKETTGTDLGRFPIGTVVSYKDILTGSACIGHVVGFGSNFMNEVILEVQVPDNHGPGSEPGNHKVLIHPCQVKIL